MIGKQASLLFKSLALLALAGFFACKNDSKNAPAAGPALPPNANPELVALTQALEKEPQNDSLRFRRAEVFYRLEGYDEAIADLQAALSLDSLQPAYYHLLTDVFLDYTKSRQAMRTMEAAVYKFPDRIPTLLKMSEVYLVVKYHSQALATLDHIFKLDPQNSEAYYMTGRVALDMGDQKRAIAALRKAVALDADNADAWVFLGHIFAEKNDPLALQYYDNALRLDSTNNETRIYKGMFYKKRGDSDKAFAVYQELVERDPDYSDAWFDMGMMYLEMDSLSKAYDHFNLAIKTDPLFVKAYYYRGVAAEQQGNAAAALADYTQANKMSPNFKEAKEALERLKK